MFKVTNKDTKTMSMTMPLSIISFVNFEQLIARWELITV